MGIFAKIFIFGLELKCCEKGFHPPLISSILYIQTKYNIKKMQREKKRINF